MHSLGLDGLRQKTLVLLTSNLDNQKKCCAMAHENCRNWGISASGHFSPLKLASMDVSTNSMHKQGLNGHQQNILAF